MPPAHHELHEEVHEILGGKNHGRVQRDHEAGPQSQVEVRSQLLRQGTSTHTARLDRRTFPRRLLCGRERAREKEVN